MNSQSSYSIRAIQPINNFSEASLLLLTFIICSTFSFSVWQGKNVSISKDGLFINTPT